MKVYCHAPEVPEELNPLLDIAYNLWWTKEPRAVELFTHLDPEIWRSVHHNPVLLLRVLGKERLEEAARNPEFMGALRFLHARMLEEVGEGATEVRRGEHEIAIEHNPLAAYFSAEFGIHESLPIYSGGLGVLAGDHVKSTSDLKIPFCGIGLLYRQGFFRQRFNLESWQFEHFEDMGFHDLPIRLVLDDDGEPMTVTLRLPEREMKSRIWVCHVGRSALFLLDSYLVENWREDRIITNRLYDSDRELRLLQEILLGVGGVRILEKLHITPRRFHMNEGHSAFLVLERAANLIAAKGLSFEEARMMTRASNVFTTHTPVAAGHEVFRRELMEPYFREQFEALKLSADEFFALGHRTGTDSDGEFEMTSLAIRFSDRINGVSELHGRVSRKQWHCMWPELDEREVPIGHVTNGVHTASWVGPEVRALLERHLAPDWIDKVEDREMWERASQIFDAELWEARNAQRHRLIVSAKRHAEMQLRRRNVDRTTLNDMSSRLSPDALTIGFARRFATYKRATLIFRHRDRLARLFENSDRPIQILFAGKAHPADDGGKRFLQDVIRLSREEPFRGRVLLLEDYDIALARLLVAGTDVWLNTPRPPKEASGTSGMKACPNGGLTLSTRDGWWVEGATPGNGWTIGDGVWESRSEEELDQVEADDLIRILEDQVVPLFWERDSRGFPVEWLRRARESMKTVTPYFNTSRMVREYAENYYTK